MNSGASPQLAFSFRARRRRPKKRRKPGRKPGPGGRRVSHKRRPELPSRFPVHVTYRLVRRLPSARRPAVFRAIRRAFNEGREAFGGRLCHFSVQRDHLHLVVEAANREALSRALHALAIRIARAINRVLGRKGQVFADRYHMRILKTPTEVKNALRYVLENRWKHHPARPDYFVEQDFCSSLAWLDSAVVAPRTWLLQSAERALRIPRPPSTPTGGWGSPQQGAAGAVALFRTSTP